MSEYIYVNDKQLEEKLKDKADKTDLKGLVTEKQLDDAMLGMSGGEINLANYYTKAEVDDAIDEKDFVISVTEIGKNKGDNNGFTEYDVSLDKTFDEIVSAYKAGKRVYVKADVSAAYGDDAEVYFEAPLVLIGGSASDGGAALFSCTDNWGRTHSINLDSDNIAVYRELGIQRQITNNLDVPAASGAVKEYVDGTANALGIEISSKADASGVYTKTDVNDRLALKANVSDVYTKTEVDAKTGNIESTLNGVGADVAALQTELDTKADKSEVKALSDTVAELGGVATEDVVPIEKGGTGAVDAASALAALGGVRIAAKQTYRGGGFCDDYLHLDFEFSPKLMFICGGGCSAVFVRDTDEAFVCGAASDSDGGAHYCELVWGGDDSVWWKSDTVMSQFNLDGEIYTAYAIG